MKPKFVSLLAEPLNKAYSELCGALTAKDFPIDFEQGIDWQEGLRQLKTGEAQYGAVCGLLYTLLRSQGYAVAPLFAPSLSNSRYAQGAVYWSDVVVRADSTFGTLDDLAGKAWLFNETGSYSGYRSFLSELARRDLGQEFFGTTTETGSHRDSFRRLLGGEGDFTVLDSTFLDYLSEEERTSVKVVASIGPSPSPLIVGNGDCSEFLRACQDLDDLPEPIAALHKVSDQDYNAIRSDWNASLKLDSNPVAQRFVFPNSEEPYPAFTSLKQQQADHDILSNIGGEMLTRLSLTPTRTLRSGPKFHRLMQGKLEHHHYLIEPSELEHGNLSLVGFLSQMKPNVNLKALFDVDAELLDQLSGYQGFLTYSPTEYADGLWANLAVFKDAESRDNWASNSTHLKAIKELGPSSYDNVRLHLGVWTSVSEPLEWVATKYLRYTNDGLWRGVRNL